MRLLGAPAFVRFLAIASAAIGLIFFLGALGFRHWHYGFFAESPMDDAFFFVRYANNFLDTGIFEWNRGEGPVHGNTSQLYQFLVVAIHWLTDRNAVLTVSLAATLGGIAYLLMVPLAYWRSRPNVDARLRWLVCALLVVLICFDGQIFLLVGTGMETTWAVAAVALSLIAGFHLERHAANSNAVLLGAASILLVYMVRPDATVLSLAGFGGLVLFSADRRTRLVAAAAGVAGILLILVFMLLCWAYYGDAVPLAVIAKTKGLTTLPPNSSADMTGYSLSYFWLTIILHVPETLLALAALFLFRRLSPVLRGAVLGAAVFIVYHLFVVVPIMGYFGRYHAPILPILALLAARTIEAILAESRIVHGFRAVTLAGAAMLAGMAYLCFFKMAPTTVRVVSSHLPALEADASLNTKAGALAFAADNVPFYRGFMARMIEAMGSDCSIASTEDGILSAYASNNRIVDLSGLHDREMARHGFSAERVLMQQKPDILSLPHPWYGAWTAALKAHPALLRDYDMELALGDMAEPIAFRRDSACAARVRRALYGR